MNSRFNFDQKPESSGKKLDLSGFEPTPLKNRSDREDELDLVAERAGFVSREAVARVQKVRKKGQVQDNIYVRAPLEVTNRFKQFCNDHSLSYGEGLEALMKKSGI